MNRNQPSSLPKAVALRYLPHEDRAPRVTAKGSGKVAEEILELAKKHGIPIQKDATLVSVLSQLELNEHIPEDLYQVVAEILTFVYRTDRQEGSKGGHT
jgi:flagellar biosynthesis protein